MGELCKNEYDHHAVHGITGVWRLFLHSKSSLISNNIFTTGSGKITVLHRSLSAYGEENPTTHCLSKWKNTPSNYENLMGDWVATWSFPLLGKVSAKKGGNEIQVSTSPEVWTTPCLKKSENVTFAGQKNTSNQPGEGSWDGVFLLPHLKSVRVTQVSSENN